MQACRLTAHAIPLKLRYGHRAWWIFLLLHGASASRADEVDMRDFIRLSRGSTQGAVLYRLGAPDIENNCYNCDGLVVNNDDPYYAERAFLMHGPNCDGWIVTNGGPPQFVCAPPLPRFTPLKAWYYIPSDRTNTNAWITEIIFDGEGRVLQRNRKRGRP